MKTLLIISITLILVTLKFLKPIRFLQWIFAWAMILDGVLLLITFSYWNPMMGLKAAEWVEKKMKGRVSAKVYRVHIDKKGHVSLVYKFEDF